MASRRKQVWAALAALAVVMLCVVFVITGSGFLRCPPGQSVEPPPSSANQDSLAASGVSGGATKPDHPPTIRIATFNIQNFGKKKLQNGPVVTKLIETVCHHDVVAWRSFREAGNAPPSWPRARGARTRPDK